MRDMTTSKKGKKTMKTVKALVAFSNGVISMEQYEVRELPTDMANDLIAAGICVEAGGGSGGGVLVLTESVNPNNSNYRDLSESFATINAALIEGKSVILKSGNYVQGTIVGTYEDEYESGGQVAPQYNVIATVVDTTNGSSQSLRWSTYSSNNPSRKITA